LATNNFVDRLTFLYSHTYSRLGSFIAPAARAPKIGRGELQVLTCWVLNDEVVVRKCIYIVLLLQD